MNPSRSSEIDGKHRMKYIRWIDQVGTIWWIEKGEHGNTETDQSILNALITRDQFVGRLGSSKLFSRDLVRCSSKLISSDLWCNWTNTREVHGEHEWRWINRIIYSNGWTNRGRCGLKVCQESRVTHWCCLWKDISSDDVDNIDAKLFSCDLWCNRTNQLEELIVRVRMVRTQMRKSSYLM